MPDEVPALGALSSVRSVWQTEGNHLLLGLLDPRTSRVSRTRSS